jgi:quercetin dioxygenase-like cupin family protein
MSSLADFRPISDEPRRFSAVHHQLGRCMSDNHHPERLSFLGRLLPSGFEMRVVVVDPGDTRAYQESDWRDALVVVERGEIRLVASGGGRRDFATGDVLCLVGLSLQALQNRGPEPAVLVAVSRKQ